MPTSKKTKTEFEKGKDNYRKFFSTNFIRPLDVLQSKEMEDVINLREKTEYNFVVNIIDMFLTEWLQQIYRHSGMVRAIQEKREEIQKQIDEFSTSDYSYFYNRFCKISTERNDKNLPEEEFEEQKRKKANGLFIAFSARSGIGREKAEGLLHNMVSRFMEINICLSTEKTLRDDQERQENNLKALVKDFSQMK